MDIPTTMTHTAVPEIVIINSRNFSSFPNCVSIAVSNDNRDTSAAAKRIAPAADKAGLLSFRYFIMSITEVITV